MTLGCIQPGDVLRTWHDTGAFGMSPIFCRVLKVAKVRVRVRSEYGQEKWADPANFDKKMRADEIDYVEWI